MMESGTQLGHYTILAALGKGGMGEVWRERGTKLGGSQRGLHHGRSTVEEQAH